MLKRSILIAALCVVAAVFVGHDRPQGFFGVPDPIPPDNSAAQNDFEEVFTPFAFTAAQRIHESMPEFEFTLEGMHVLVTDNGEVWWDGHEIEALTITGTDGLHQVFDSLYTSNTRAEESNSYGLELEDWNFDGFLDVSLLKYPGGAGSRGAYYFWLWNPETGRFEANTQLEELTYYSTLEAVPASGYVVSYYQLDHDSYGTSSYRYEDDGSLTEIKRVEEIWETDENDGLSVRVIVYELMFGEMVVIDDYYLAIE